MAQGLKAAMRPSNRSRSAGDVKFGAVAPLAPVQSPARRLSRLSRLSRASRSSSSPAVAESKLPDRPAGDEDLGERFQSLGFLEVQRRSAKLAGQLKDLLSSYQKPSLATKKCKLEKGQTAKILFDSSDDLEQLLKAEELQRQSTWMPDLRRSMTIDDTAAAEINHARRGTEAIRLTSDLNPAFAEAMVRFGILRNDVIDKAKEKREKADRLLSHMSNQVQYGIKRRLRRSRTPQKLVEVKEPSEDSEEDLEDLSQKQQEERQQRKQLKKSVAKFDKWMASYLEREGLKPPKLDAPDAADALRRRRRRPSTAPAMRAMRRPS